MAKKRPVTICATRQRPNKEPKFHQIDKLLGAGKSTNLLLAIFAKGWVFRNGINILLIEGSEGGRGAWANFNYSY